MQKLAIGAGYALNQYFIRNALYTQEQDGKAQVACAFYAARRIFLVGQHLQLVTNMAISPHTNKLSWVPLGMALFSKFVLPFTSKQVAEAAKEDGKLLIASTKPVFEAIRFLGATEERLDSWSEAIDKALNSSNILLDTACVASYVAMIALGMPIQGSIGLAAVTMTFLKKQGFIPNQVEKILEVAAFIANILAIKMTNLTTYSLVMMSIGFSLGLLSLASNWEFLEHFMPKCLYEAKPGHHEMQECDISRDLLARLIQDPSNFQVNPTHIHAPEVHYIMPPEQMTHFKSLSSGKMKDEFTRMYTAFRQKCQEFGVVYEVTEEEKKDLEAVQRDLQRKKILQLRNGSQMPSGELESLKSEISGLNGRLEFLRSSIGFAEMAQVAFRRLENALIYGVVGDGGVDRIEEMQIGLAGIIHSFLMEESEEEFIKKAHEWLTILGDNCSEGWLRESAEFVKGEGNNYRWGIHNALAKMRGAIVQEVFTDPSSECSGVLQLFAPAVGETNSVHFVDPIHKGLWPFFRTYEGEKAMRSSASIIENAYYYFFQPGNKYHFQKDNLEQSFYPSFSMNAGISNSPLGLSGMLFLRAIIKPIFSRIRLEYNVPRIIESLKTAVELKRISFEMIKRCAEELNETYPELFIFDEQGNVSSDFVTVTNPLEQSDATEVWMPTEKMITLTLWHMGILDANLT